MSVCCKIQVTPFEKILDTLYRQVARAAANIFGKIYQYEVFGRNCAMYNMLMDLQYLAILLSIIYQQVLQDQANQPDCTLWNPPSYYYNLYKLDCIVRKFDCLGLNIRPMLTPFLTGNSMGVDGIDYMQEQGNGPCPPPFIVAPNS